MVIPVFVLPMFSGIAARGWRGAAEFGRHRRSRSIGSPPRSCSSAPSRSPGIWSGWVPRVGSFTLEMLSFTVRAKPSPISYSSPGWIFLASLTSGGKAGFNPPKDTTPIDPCGYVPNIAAGQTFVMQVAREILRNSEYTFLASYESLSGQRYETRSTLNNLVLTGFSFAPFKRATLRQILAAAIRGATEGAKGQPWLAPELTRFFRRRER
jgi:hypothetical protein